MFRKVSVKSRAATRGRLVAPYLAQLVVAILISGCGSSDRPDLGHVTGTVILDGQPLPGAYVTFIQRGFRPSSGVTDTQGRYELMYLDIPGVALGTHTVQIETDSGAEGVAASNPLPSRYHRDSTIERVVKPGENVFDFELTGDN